MNPQAVTQSGLYYLLGWAIFNIVVGGVLAFAGKGAWKPFGIFSAGWNVVNLALAANGIHDATAAMTQHFTVLEAIREVAFLKTLFLINAGLDVAYITWGLWLRDKSTYTETKRERNLGWGWSLILQGGFLLVFDSVMGWLNHELLVKLLLDV
jgi:hypothetical protein